MQETTFTDHAGDTLILSVGDGVAYIDCEEGDQHTEIELDAEQTRDLGRALCAASPSDDNENPLLVPEYDTEREAYNAEALTLALDRERLAVFQYEKGKGSASMEKRRVRPNDAYLSAEGDPIVVGHDPDRGGTRAFRLDRIVGHVRIG